MSSISPPHAATICLVRFSCQRQNQNREKRQTIFATQKINKYNVKVKRVTKYVCVYEMGLDWREGGFSFLGAIEKMERKLEVAQAPFCRLWGKFRDRIGTVGMVPIGTRVTGIKPFSCTIYRILWYGLVFGIESTVQLGRTAGKRSI